MDECDLVSSFCTEQLLCIMQKTNERLQSKLDNAQANLDLLRNAEQLQSWQEGLKTSLNKKATAQIQGMEEASTSPLKVAFLITCRKLRHTCVLKKVF